MSRTIRTVIEIDEDDLKEYITVLIDSKQIERCNNFAEQD
jgi:hypothetical protein